MIRIVESMLMGGWLVVRGQTPISGTFASEDEARSWIDRRKEEQPQQDWGEEQ